MRLFSKAPSTTEIDVRSAHSLLQEGATLVDVREDHEWSRGRAAGARHIALGKLQGQVRSIPQAKPVLVICASGNRSRGAAKFLREQGFDARSVSGGTSAWARANLPIQT